MSKNLRWHTAVIVLSTVGIIFWLGRLSLQYQLSSRVPVLQQIGDVNVQVPMIEIDSIENGKLMGSVNRPELRLKSGTEVAVPDEDLHFALDIKHLGFAAKSDPRLKVPAGAKFVASKNGQYFYALDEATAKRLTPLTRVFFTTEEEAQAAGYKKRSQ